MQILLIEGNERYGDSIKQKLQSYGHTVDLTFNFDGAQLMFETKAFDMIIVELETPEESIIDFLQYLRHTNKETPVYALTADYAVSTSFKELKFDMVDVMNSPFDNTNITMAQKDPVLAPKIIQPKTFHNFCLN
jgi:DNA-binding response OmpR family regulator